MRLGRFHKIGRCFLLALLLLLMACPASRQRPVEQTAQKESMSRRDIGEVLRYHDEELMAIPGVVGVYVGLMPDDKTPCLKVMVVKETEDLKKRIPKTLEGYPVLIEESGVIHPLSDKSP
jgi:hypothetical protein